MCGRQRRSFLLLLTIFAGLFLLLSYVPLAVAQVFSVDPASPLATAPGGSPANLYTPGPVLYAPAKAIGLLPADDIDALSFGFDDVGSSTVYFSTGFFAKGALTPGNAVCSEAGLCPPAVPCPPETAADIFSTPGLGIATVLFDGDGAPGTAPPLGLTECPAGEPAGDDNVDAFDDLVAPLVDGHPAWKIYFSLAPGSPTLTGANPLLPGGAGPADILVYDPWQKSLSVFFTAAGMGLAAGDNIDGISLNVLTSDILFSLAPGSPSLLPAAGICPAGCTPGDFIRSAGPICGLLPCIAGGLDFASAGLASGDNVDAVDNPGSPPAHIFDDVSPGKTYSLDPDSPTLKQVKTGPPMNRHGSPADLLTQDTSHPTASPIIVFTAESLGLQPDDDIDGLSFGREPVSFTPITCPDSDGTNSAQCPSGAPTCSAGICTSTTPCTTNADCPSHTFCRQSTVCVGSRDYDVEFSVDRGAIGLAGTAVFTETTAATGAEASPDIFDSFMPAGSPPPGTNRQSWDGNGSSAPNLQLRDVPLNIKSNDNLDALEGPPQMVDTNNDGTRDLPVYFSLAAGSPTLLLIPGASERDILICAAPSSGGVCGSSALPSVFISSTDLGIPSNINNNLEDFSLRRVCSGGPTPGIACQCLAPGRCEGGQNAGNPCTATGQCPGGYCDTGDATRAGTPCTETTADCAAGETCCGVGGACTLADVDFTLPPSNTLGAAPGAILKRGGFGPCVGPAPCMIFSPGDVGLLPGDNMNALDALDPVRVCVTQQNPTTTAPPDIRVARGACPVCIGPCPTASFYDIIEGELGELTEKAGEVNLSRGFCRADNSASDRYTLNGGTDPFTRPRFILERRNGAPNYGLSTLGNPRNPSAGDCP